jgi:hypothetical protein
VAIGAAVVVLAALAAVVLAGTNDDREAASRPGSSPVATPVAPNDAGCSRRDMSDRPFRAGAETGPIAGTDPLAGRICAYDQGHLVGSHRLSAGEAAELAAAVRAGPDGIGPEGLGCPDGYDYLDGPLEPHFTAHLSYAEEARTDLWVYGNVCTPSGVVNNVGRFVRVAPRLADLLGRLVRTPRPFPVTDPSLPPGPVPTGPMTDGECPDGITREQPFAHETARQAKLRLGAPVFATYPDARWRGAGLLGGQLEEAVVRADGSRVARFVTQRLPGHRWWSLRTSEMCVTSAAGR